MALPGRVASYTLGEDVHEEQIQPAGVDLRVGEIRSFRSAGSLGVRERRIADSDPVEPTGGWWVLARGVYKVVFQDVVYVPSTAVGFCFPRSSLLRSGVLLSCAVWDPGYYGRGEALLEVINPHGFRVQVGARIAQLVYVPLLSASSVYDGAYRGENLRQRRRVRG
jgi:dUTP pyrophosphatase